MLPGSTGWRLRKDPQERRYHAVAEEGVPLREIAEAIGRGLKVPVVSQIPRGGSRAFWLPRVFVGARRSGLKRANAGTAGMATDAAAWTDCRPRPRDGVQSPSERS